MNKNRKILMILLVLLIGSLFISTVNAKTYTTKAIKFIDSENNPVNKDIGNGSISIFYNSKYSKQLNSKNTFTIVVENNKNPGSSETYKLIKAKIKFTKKVNGKTKTTTEIYKSKNTRWIQTQPPKGWKPYSTIITYDYNSCC